MTVTEKNDAQLQELYTYLDNANTDKYLAWYGQCRAQEMGHRESIIDTIEHFHLKNQTWFQHRNLPDLEELPDPEDPTESLIAGQKYFFEYMIPDVHRKPRHGCAMYLSAVMHTGKPGMSLTFSGRPEFGTTTLDSSWIKSIEPVAGDADCYMDRKA